MVLTSDTARQMDRISVWFTARHCLCIILLLPPSYVSAADCDLWHQWHLQYPEERCLWISSVQLNWVDSVDACASIHGRLAHIKNPGEAIALDAVIGPDAKDYWLPVNDQASEGVFMDLDGPVSWFKWRSDQPNDVGSTQNCVAVIGGTWQDKPCAQLYFFVCEHWPATANVGGSVSFQLLYTGMVHSQSAYETTEVTSLMRCARRCLTHSHCFTFYVPVTPGPSGGMTCMLVVRSNGVLPTPATAANTSAKVYRKIM